MPSCRLNLVLRRPELFHEDLENEFRADFSVISKKAQNIHLGTIECPLRMA